MRSTSVRIDAKTHQELKKLAATQDATIGETVKLAVRQLRQYQIGKELRGESGETESPWLDADLG